MSARLRGAKAELWGGEAGALHGDRIFSASFLALQWGSILGLIKGSPVNLCCFLYQALVYFLLSS